MNETMLQAFADEVESIQKEAGFGSWLTGGVKTLGQLGSKGKLSLKGLATTGRRAYQAGAAKGGVMGGLKRFATSRAGQAAGVAGLGGLAAYGGYKATLGRDRRPRPAGY